MYVTPGLTFRKSTFCPRNAVCDLCGSQNKQRLFPYTALIDWIFIADTECVYCAVRAESVNVIQVNLSL